MNGRVKEMFVCVTRMYACENEMNGCVGKMYACDREMCGWVEEKSGAN